MFLVQGVQISASSHADAGQSGGDFFRFHLHCVCNRYRLRRNRQRVKLLHRANSQKSSNLDLYLSAVIKWLKSSVTLGYRKKLYRAMFMATKSTRECSMQTGCVRPTVSLRIVCCLSKMCIVSKKKNTATDAFIEDFFGRQYQLGNMKNVCLKLFHEETANYSITLTTEEHL